MTPRGSTATSFGAHGNLVIDLKQNLLDTETRYVSSHASQYIKEEGTGGMRPPRSGSYPTEMFIVPVILGEDDEEAEEECGSAVAKEFCCNLGGKGCTGNPVMWNFCPNPIFSHIGEQFPHVGEVNLISFMSLAILIIVLPCLNEGDLLKMKNFEFT